MGSGMGSALAVLAVADDPQAEITWVLQGVIVGIGLLGRASFCIATATARYTD